LGRKAPLDELTQHKKVRKKRRKKEKWGQREPKINREDMFSGGTKKSQADGSGQGLSEVVRKRATNQNAFEIGRTDQQGLSNWGALRGEVGL